MPAFHKEVQGILKAKKKIKKQNHLKRLNKHQNLSQICQEWWDQEFFKTVINVLREKADDMQEQMDTVNRETEILRKNKKDVPEIGNTDGNEERPGRVCQ